MDNTMNPTHHDPDGQWLVEAAAEALDETIQTPIMVDPPPAEDAWFRIHIPEWKLVFAAAPYPRPMQLRGIGPLSHWLEHVMPSPRSSLRRVAVIDYAAHTTAFRLRQFNICFIDTAGNAYLNDKGRFIFIQGRKKPRAAARPQNRAFSRSGLQVLFGLLVDPPLLGETYRIIADTVSVSHGTVGTTLESLKALGYLEEASGRRLLRRHTELRTRWAAGYAETLRPRLLRNRFRFTDPSQASERIRALPPELGLWSGGPGADLLTGHLKPDAYTLFSTAPPSELARALGVVRDKEGPLDVLRPFWSTSWVRARSQAHPGVANPLLVWADLLATGDARSQDAAAMVLDILEAEYAETSVGTPEEEAS